MDADNELKRKYEILPGVIVPDMKTLAEASENYDTVGVEDFEVKATVPRFMSDGKPDVATAAELAQLQALGVEVAEAESRQSEESRKRMESILSTAVSAPSTLNDLKKDAAKKISEEKKKELEESMREQEEAKAAEEAKIKAREDRKKLQQQIYEESKKKAEEQKAKAAEEAKVAEDKKEPAKTEEASKPAEPEKTEKTEKTEEPAKPAVFVKKAAEPVKPAEPVKKEIVTESVDADASADLAFAEFGDFVDPNILGIEDEEEDVDLLIEDAPADEPAKEVLPSALMSDEEEEEVIIDPDPDEDPSDDGSKGGSGFLFGS